MKIRIEIDCSPEEARSFLGLPDLMLDAVSNLTPTVMRAWLPWIQFPSISPDTEEKAARAMDESAGQTSGKASRLRADEGG